MTTRRALLLALVAFALGFLVCALIQPTGIPRNCHVARVTAESGAELAGVMKVCGR